MDETYLLCGSVSLGSMCACACVHVFVLCIRLSTHYITATFTTQLWLEEWWWCEGGTSRRRRVSSECEAPVFCRISSETSRGKLYALRWDAALSPLHTHTLPAIMRDVVPLDCTAFRLIHPVSVLASSTAKLVWLPPTSLQTTQPKDGDGRGGERAGRLGAVRGLSTTFFVTKRNRCGPSYKMH